MSRWPPLVAECAKLLCVDLQNVDPYLLHDAMLVQYMLLSCLCVSVYHMPVLYRNGYMD